MSGEFFVMHQILVFCCRFSVYSWTKDSCVGSFSTVVHVYMLFYHLSAHRYMKTMFLQFSDYISIDKINCCQWIISELAVVKQLGYMYSATFISTLMTVLFSLRNSKKNFFDHTLTP